MRTHPLKMQCGGAAANARADYLNRQSSPESRTKLISQNTRRTNGESVRADAFRTVDEEGRTLCGCEQRNRGLDAHLS